MDVAAISQVQIMLLGDRDFPIHTARGKVDETSDTAIRAVMALNDTITAREAILAIWEEGAKLVAARAGRKQLPARFGRLVPAPKAPKPKPNPRPVR